jgi:branched-chain amino acid aminotransferase
VIIIAGSIQLYPEELYETGIKVVSATTVRNHPLSLSPQIKSCNYLNNILAKIEALDRNVPEAIMYNQEGYVAEATGDNVFLVRTASSTRRRSRPAAWRESRAPSSSVWPAGRGWRWWRRT